MRRQRAAASIAIVLLAPLSSVSVRAQRVTFESVTALHRWVDAVNHHVPGRPDAAVANVVAMTYAARVTLNTPFPLFIRVLRQESVAIHGEFDKDVIAIARAVGDDPGTPTFLKRAALLHADAV